MLFTKKDIKKNPSAKQQVGFSSNEPSKTFTLQSLKDLESNIGQLETGFHYHFWSKGQWSMHELLQFIVQKVGKSDVWMTTWTITENPVRCLFGLKKDNLIGELHCILDYRIKGRKPGPFQFLKKIADSITLTQCHAKSLVIVNENWKVSVVGSANFSQNPRLEAGVICTVPEVVDFNLKIMKNEILQ
jgi:hypothetical protein